MVTSALSKWLARSTSASFSHLSSRNTNARSSRVRWKSLLKIFTPRTVGVSNNCSLHFSNQSFHLCMKTHLLMIVVSNLLMTFLGSIVLPLYEQNTTFIKQNLSTLTRSHKKIGSKKTEMPKTLLFSVRYPKKYEQWHKWQSDSVLSERAGFESRDRLGLAFFTSE